MGYRHIDNLYKDPSFLQNREDVFALEKIHGTSAHISWRNGRIHLHNGGASAVAFQALFNLDALRFGFEAAGLSHVTIFGEAYGGSQQKQAWRYGDKLKFVAFEVHTPQGWLSTPAADAFVRAMKLEFVHYKRIPATLEAVDAERDATSEQARRNGVEGFIRREGVVLRPVTAGAFDTEFDEGGNPLRMKHKRDEERETASPRAVIDPAKQQVLDDAQAIADEWVTPTRLEHVLDKIPGPHGMEQTKQIIEAMVEDVMREGRGELIDSKEARAAIGKATAKLLKQHLQSELKRATSGQ